MCLICAIPFLNDFSSAVCQDRPAPAAEADGDVTSMIVLLMSVLSDAKHFRFGATGAVATRWSTGVSKSVSANVDSPGGTPARTCDTVAYAYFALPVRPRMSQLVAADEGEIGAHALAALQKSDIAEVCCERAAARYEEVLRNGGFSLMQVQKI